VPSRLAKAAFALTGISALAVGAAELASVTSSPPSHSSGPTVAGSHAGSAGSAGSHAAPSLQRKAGARSKRSG